MDADYFRETITYYYETTLYLSNGDAILYHKTESYPQPLKSDQENKLLQDCIKGLQENEYVQFRHSAIFSKHVVKIEIKMRRDSFY